MKWGPKEKESWFKEQTVKRSYQTEVVAKIDALRAKFDVQQYGALSISVERYPLLLIKSKAQDRSKKTVLITGGVHGYETSGVQGALGFLQKEAQNYADSFNILCAPCISPWAYETINRWNPKAIDPNRNFNEDSPAEECAFFLRELSNYDVYAHIDLHETTDTDNTIFRPALAARDDKEQDKSDIPDGFYLVGDTENPQPEFQKAIIEQVKKVTHIAPPDRDGKIIGETLEQEGVINYPLKKLNLCTGFSDAKFTTTTEVYPDSPKTTPEICIDSQITAVKAGLDFLKNL